jgi:hypothetical protein
MDIQLSPDAHLRYASNWRQFSFNACGCNIYALVLFFVVVGHSSDPRGKQSQEQRNQRPPLQFSGL